MTSKFAPFIAILFLLGHACAEEEEPIDIASLFPADNEVGSWVEDASAMGFSGPNPAGLEVAKTSQAAYDAVDGDTAPFEQYDFVALAREFYIHDTGSIDDPKLQLRIWEFPDAAAASGFYDAFEDFADYNRTWTASSLGDRVRWRDPGLSYTYNATKGAFFIDMIGLTPNDAPTQTKGEAFLTEVLGRIP